MDHVIDGSVKMSFTSRAAWHATQLECPYLRHTHAHLIQGTRPSYKKTKNRRRQEISKKAVPKMASWSSEIISFPTTTGEGGIFPLGFPPPYLQQILLRTRLRQSVRSCVSHQCQAIKSILVYLRPQSSTQAPNVVGSSLAADDNHAHSAKI
ncbi:hypothetical protein NP493_5213g00003 [Ridgeia piscesae]|uniref:Uncharacterized protein n=1 Tax=Ridgeia piscesae TaxID=27915 RepID=A0AAD9MSN3_RIDPI|nr:hypothetical protein NP493_5213g00003 [Ridgeia piscesae]